MKEYAALQAQNQMYEQQLDLCSRQAEEWETYYLKIQRMRHDMSNHLLSLLGLVRSGELEEAEGYIQTMLEDGIGDQADEVSQSRNIIVDSLVNHKYALAQKDGIPFEANIVIPAVLPFQGGHLTVVLGNLLDNALEACRKLPQKQRYIQLEVTYVKGLLKICVSNSCLPLHEKDNKGRYLTTKEDKLHHGVGLSSVEQVAAYYQGEMLAEDDGNKFQVVVVMYDKDSPQ